MLTVGTVQPLMAEALPIPTLNLSGRVPPNNTIVALDASIATPELIMWPEFHNGVAAAFRVGLMYQQQSSDGMHRVTKNWILYNKTHALQSKTTGDNAHAGGTLILSHSRQHKT